MPSSASYDKLDFMWCIADNVRDILAGKTKPWIENQFAAVADEVVFSVTLTLALHDAQARRLEDIMAIIVPGSTDELIKFRRDKILKDPVLAPLYRDEIRMLQEVNNSPVEIINGVMFADLTKKHIISLAAREAVQRIQVCQIPHRRHPLNDLYEDLWIMSVTGRHAL